MESEIFDMSDVHYDVQAVRSSRLSESIKDTPWKYDDVLDCQRIVYSSNNDIKDNAPHMVTSRRKIEFFNILWEKDEPLSINHLMSAKYQNKERKYDRISDDQSKTNCFHSSFQKYSEKSIKWWKARL